MTRSETNALGKSPLKVPLGKNDKKNAECQSGPPHFSSVPGNSVEQRHALRDLMHTIGGAEEVMSAFEVAKVHLLLAVGS